MKTTALLRDLTHSFAGNRAVVSKAIRELYESDPQTFLEDAANVLRDAEDSPGTRYILALLSPRPDFLQLLCDPRSFTPSQSAGLLRQVKFLDARVERKLVNMVATLDYESDQATVFATHCLEILSLLCDGAAALPVLRELLHCPSARVRSKAALLIGHISRNPQWAKLTDVHQDVRVVANAVESIWGLDTSVAKEVFRDAVTSELHRRAVNGAVGLYLARQPEAIGSLYRFARHEQSDFRAAAAWGMGRTGDPRFVQILDTLRNDSEELVRTAAARAAALLAERLELLKKAPQIALQVTSADFQDGEHTVRVHIEDPAKLLRLDALHFSLTNGSMPVEKYTFAELQGAQGHSYELHFGGPRSSSRLIKVEVFTDRGCGAGTASETGDEVVKPIAEVLRNRHQPA